MNDSDSVTFTNRHETAPPAESSRLAMWFPEGIAVPLLMLALIGNASFSVQYGGWENLVIPIGAIGVVGGLCGVVAAKFRTPDSIAHFGGLTLGAVVVFASVLFEADSLGEDWRTRIRPLGTFMVDWYLGRRPSGDDEHLLVSMLVGLVVWLIGYLGTWTVFRRRWLMVGVSLPALLTIVNLGFMEHPRSWALGLMLLIAMPLCARYNLFQRQHLWAHHGVKEPVGLAGRVLGLSMVVAILVTGISWQTVSPWSESGLQPVLQQLTQRFTATQQRASTWLDQAVGPEGGIGDAGSYTAFDESYAIGGPLELTEQEEVFVTGDLDQAPYLTARRYDFYTGRGWATSIEERFPKAGDDGERYSTELLFREGQSVVLSPTVTGERLSQTMSITPLTRDPGVVFSTGAYQTASIGTAVRMSWRQLNDEPFAVTAGSLTSLPPDIQLMSSLLLQGRLTGQPMEQGPRSSDGQLQVRIDAEVENLRNRMVTVRWDTDADGVVQNLYVTGILPVYDDVEAIFPRYSDATAAPGSYDVTGLISTAKADALQAAGKAYPEWVNARYLQLGSSVTPRTIELAQDIASGADNPYDQAVLIEQWLRTNIAYDERVAAPPDGADVVDYTLFGNRRGYCEHYSASMTIMMRALGVPARTVVGYYPGQYDEARDGFVYRQLNAHAWTEVFFPSYGWIPFEPTANRPLYNRVGEQNAGAQTPVSTSTPSERIPVPEAARSASTPTLDPPAFDEPNPPAITKGDEGRETPDWHYPFAAAAGALVAMASSLWLAWNWNLRGLRPSAAFFRRLQRVGRLVGVQSSSTTTPREYASDVSRSFPGAGPPARHIVHVYELDEYGRDHIDQGRLELARDAWRRLRSQLPYMLVRRPTRG